MSEKANVADELIAAERIAWRMKIVDYLIAHFPDTAPRGALSAMILAGFSKAQDEGMIDAARMARIVAAGLGNDKRIGMIADGIERSALNNAKARAVLGLLDT